MLEVFVYTEEDYSLSEEVEAATIVEAQAGSESAKEILIRAYGPALRSAVSRFGNGVRGGRTARGSRLEAGNTDLDLADLQSAAFVAFLEVIESHDATKSPRLAGRVSQYLQQRLAEEFSAAAAFTVPSRTLKRFYGVLKAADGDASVALAIAPEFGMGKDTFASVLAAVRGTDSLEGVEGTTGLGGATAVYATSPVADVEDRMLVEHAFGAVTDDEARIVELAYGFTEYEPVPDAEIAHRLSMTRPTVQRRRSSALGSMRKALGVSHV